MEPHGKNTPKRALSIMARPNAASAKHEKALTMKSALSNTCHEDYKKRRSAFLNELIASTPNVIVRAKEFRRWIDENSPNGDQ
jgi:hypothetical protein